MYKYNIFSMFFGPLVYEECPTYDKIEDVINGEIPSKEQNLPNILWNIILFYNDKSVLFHVDW